MYLAALLSWKGKFNLNDFKEVKRKYVQDELVKLYEFLQPILDKMGLPYNLEVFTEYLNDYKEIEDIPELDTDNERVPF